jgi:integrase
VTRQPSKVRNPRGQFVDKDWLNEVASGGRPAVLPPKPAELVNWNFRWYRKRSSWHVDGFGPAYLGKKLRRLSRHTPELAHAEALLRERRHHEYGRLAELLSPPQLVEMVECCEICAPFGITPRTACENYRERHKGTRHTFRQVVDEVIAIKREIRRNKRYVDGLERELHAMDDQNPGKRIADYTTEDLRRELKRHPDWEPATIKGAVMGFNVVFNHAIKFKYIVDNPCTLLELPRIIRKEPTKFSVSQVQRGLAACLTSREMLDCLAWFAIGNFSGLRPHETEQLLWEQVSFETKTIIVLVETSKRRQRRPVKIEPVLEAWLRPLYREHGGVMPLNLDKTRTRMRKSLGLSHWPDDILRHDFASYHYAKFGNLMETRKQMGHTDETPDVFFNHYCALVTPPDQDLYWECFPPWKSDLELAAKYLRDLGWAVKMQLRTLALPAPAEVKCQP